jgi:hypothetical protein
MVTHYDADVEASLVGAMLVWPDRLEIGRDLGAEDFYTPKWAACWQAVCELVGEGAKPDPMLVADRAQHHGASVAPADLLTAQTDALPPQRAHVEIVLRHSAARRLQLAAQGALQALADGSDPHQIADSLAADIGTIDTLNTSGTPEAITMPELVETADKLSPWVIPGLVRSDWRAVIVGTEGSGKSVLLRQLAVLAAQGIHPLRFSAIEPVRTLVVDLENSAHAIAETGASLDAQVRCTAGDGYDSSRCRIWSRPAGLDIRNRKDRSALEREIRAQRPDLVTVGPLYKTYRRSHGESYEDAAEEAQARLDDLRTRYGFGLLLEHHAPKGSNGTREMSPFGSQRWLAWPDLGIGLQRTREGVTLGRFRGDRLLNDWPQQIRRDRVWPWTGIWESGMPRRALSVVSGGDVRRAYESDVAATAGDPS